MIRYSEIFRSIQGEGMFTGHNTVWLRLWGCPLSCAGFMQKDPTDPSTYVNPWQGFDMSKVHRLEDLPVLTHGCDSAYSHEKDFLKFALKSSAAELAQKLLDLAGGDFVTSRGQDTHLCFTGGEPLMSPKTTIGPVIQELTKLGKAPRNVTFETNGMYGPVSRDLLDTNSIKVLYSVSPKLFTVSGEKNSKAILPDVIADLLTVPYTHAQLKFVVANKKESWEELEHVVDLINKELNYTLSRSIWIMPVGATNEQQTAADAIAVIDEAIRRGYHVSARLQNYIWNNAVGK